MIKAILSLVKRSLLGMTTATIFLLLMFFSASSLLWVIWNHLMPNVHIWDMWLACIGIILLVFILEQAKLFLAVGNHFATIVFGQILLMIHGVKKANQEPQSTETVQPAEEDLMRHFNELR